MPATAFAVVLSDAYTAGSPAAVENEQPGTVSVETISELHSRLGDAAALRGDFELAGTNYQAALRLAPHLTDCWCSLGNVHLRSGRPQEAVAFYLQALRLNPGHWPARTHLVEAMMATQQYVVARGLLLKLASERPQDGQIRRQLGKTHFELNELDSAIECFQRAVALDPGDADSINWIGGLKHAIGDIEGAQAAYAQAARMQPLIRKPAAISPAEFRILTLYAPFGGNLPTEYLFKDAFYDIDTFALFAWREDDSELFSEDAEVVVNLISDADQTESLLPSAASLVDRLGKPTVNDPRRIQGTTRDAVACLLQGIPGCRIPRALRHKAGAISSPEVLQAALPFSFPVLARPVGTHGGDDFEKIEGPVALASFLSQRPDRDHYLIEYIDYRSDDGYFRKYRFIFVDGQILPYHLCIGSDWKVHHISTDMANQPWMQQEEEAFLNNPRAVFDPAHDQALQTIQRRIGLEYCGIDCALDVYGNLVVFEVNASMLVHGRNEAFPYKMPAVERIKLAFDAMLRKFAGRAGDRAVVAFDPTSIPGPEASPSVCSR
jgi:tetratricopeptide (TPR) repeat protein